jgi:hypothetical protein
MALIFDGRYTARLERPLVLFLIGMRFNKLILVNKWLPVFLAMPRMLKELHQHPEAGLSAAKDRIAPDLPPSGP